MFYVAMYFNEYCDRWRNYIFVDFKAAVQIVPLLPDVNVLVGILLGILG